MNIKTAITENSVWKFDMDLNRYIRFPRGEVPHPQTILPYTGEWDDFISLERVGDRLRIHRDRPWGSGALRETGIIEFDDLPV